MNTKKKQYHHGDLRATLLEVAARIIAEDGVEKVTMRTLSQQSGVSRSAPYRHFPDKTTLLCAVAADGFKKLENQLKKVAEIPSTDELSRFENMAIAYVDLAVSNPSYYRLMFGREDLLKAPTPELRANAKAAFDVFQEILREWQQNNSLINDDSFFLRNVLWATVHGISMLLIDRQILNEKIIQSIHPLPIDESTLPSSDDTRKLIKFTIKTIIDGMRKQHL